MSWVKDILAAITIVLLVAVLWTACGAISQEVRDWRVVMTP